MRRGAAGRRPQAGYLQEVPLLLMLTGIAAALLPALPVWLARPLAVVLALLAGAGLWYMLVIPGWTPGRGPSPPRWRRLLAFAVLFAVIVLLTADFLLAPGASR